MHLSERKRAMWCNPKCILFFSIPSVSVRLCVPGPKNIQCMNTEQVSTLNRMICFVQCFNNKIKTRLLFNNCHRLPRIHLHRRFGTLHLCVCVCVACSLILSVLLFYSCAHILRLWSWISCLALVFFTCLFNSLAFVKDDYLKPRWFRFRCCCCKCVVRIVYASHLENEIDDVGGKWIVLRPQRYPINQTKSHFGLSNAVWLNSSWMMSCRSMKSNDFRIPRHKCSNIYNLYDGQPLMYPISKMWTNKKRKLRRWNRNRYIFTLTIRSLRNGGILITFKTNNIRITILSDKFNKQRENTTWVFVRCCWLCLHWIKRENSSDRNNE